MIRALLVDDDRDLARLLSDYLGNHDVSLTHVEDGPRGLKALADATYDVVLLDVMLPGIDGYSLQLKISQEPALKGLPIIVLTALEPSKTLFQKFPQVQAFMTKPFKTEELLSAAQQAVERSHTS